MPVFQYSTPERERSLVSSSRLGSGKLHLAQSPTWRGLKELEMTQGQETTMI